MPKSVAHLLFRKDSATLRERASVALASLERNAYAMGMLRSRIESRADFILKSQGSGDEYRELARVLELVKNGELVINELSGKIEAARFLEEFVAIINGAAESVGAVKGDVEHLVPLAENALAEMQDTISKISGGLYTPNPEPAQLEVQESILAEAATAAAAPEQQPAKRQQQATSPSAVVGPKAIPSIEAPRQKEAEAELA